MKVMALLPSQFRYVGRGDNRRYVRGEAGFHAGEEKGMPSTNSELIETVLGQIKIDLSFGEVLPAANCLINFDTHGQR